MDPEVTLLLTLEFPLSWHLDSLPPPQYFLECLEPISCGCLEVEPEQSDLSLGESGLAAQD